MFSSCIGSGMCDVSDITSVVAAYTRSFRNIVGARVGTVAPLGALTHTLPRTRFLFIYTPHATIAGGKERCDDRQIDYI